MHANRNRLLSAFLTPIAKSASLKASGQIKDIATPGSSTTVHSNLQTELLPGCCQVEFPSGSEAAREDPCLTQDDRIEAQAILHPQMTIPARATHLFLSLRPNVYP